jgi:hypothetical protein
MAGKGQGHDLGNQGSDWNVISLRPCETAAISSFLSPRSYAPSPVFVAKRPKGVGSNVGGESTAR